jgi:hypothetical protein
VAITLSSGVDIADWVIKMGAMPVADSSPHANLLADASPACAFEVAVGGAIDTALD